MRWAVDEFEHDFAHWDLHLPADAVDTRRGGQIRDAGWNIRYNFGADARGEYLDYYASPRDVQVDPPSDDWHVRLYASGQRAELPTVLEAYMYGRDPTWEELERVRRQYLDRLEVTATESATERATDDAPDHDDRASGESADDVAWAAQAPVVESLLADPPRTDVADVEPLAIDQSENELAAIESPAIESVGIKPSAIEPPAIEPPAIEPPAIDTAVVESTAVDSALVEPAPLQSALVQPGPIETRASEELAIAEPLEAAMGEAVEPRPLHHAPAVDPTAVPAADPPTDAPYLALDIGLDVDLDIEIPLASESAAPAGSSDIARDESLNANPTTATPATMDASAGDEIEIIPLETPNPLEIEADLEEPAPAKASIVDRSMGRATPSAGIVHEEMAPITLVDGPGSLRDGLSDLGLIAPLLDLPEPPNSSESPSAPTSRPSPVPHPEPEARSSELVLIFPTAEGPDSEDESPAEAGEPVATPPAPALPTPTPASPAPPHATPQSHVARQEATLAAQQEAEPRPAGNNPPPVDAGTAAGQTTATEGDPIEPALEPIPVGSASDDLPAPYDVEPVGSAPSEPAAAEDGPWQDTPDDQSGSASSGSVVRMPSESPSATARARARSGAPGAHQPAVIGGKKVFLRADPVLTADVAAINARVGPETFAPWWLRGRPRRFVLAAAAVVVVAAVAAASLAHHRSRVAAAAQAARADSAEQDDTAPSPIRINPAAVLADSAARAADSARASARDAVDTASPVQNGPRDSGRGAPDRADGASDGGPRGSDDGVARPSGPGSLPPIERSRPSTVHQIPAATPQFRTGAH